MVAMACETRRCRTLGSRRSARRAFPRSQQRCRRHPGDGPWRRGVIDRYYDPATGQFSSVDPKVEETDQAYDYATDDPVDAKDPSGTHTWSGDGGGCGTLGRASGGYWIRSVWWSCTPPGFTLTVNPSGAARFAWYVNPIFTSVGPFLSAAWHETVRLSNSVAPPGVIANTKTMYDQFVCHWVFVRPFPWRGFHLQNWYPSASQYAEIKNKCNAQ
jgi:hypothetical protein